MENNFIRYTGYGWGGLIRNVHYSDPHLVNQTAAICCFGLPTNVSNIVIKNNLLQFSKQSLLCVAYQKAINHTYQDNILIQEYSGLLVKEQSTLIYSDDDKVQELLTNTLGNSSTTVIICEDQMLALGQSTDEMVLDFGMFMFEIN